MLKPKYLYIYKKIIKTNGPFINFQTLAQLTNNFIYLQIIICKLKTNIKCKPTWPNKAPYFRPNLGFLKK